MIKSGRHDETMEVLVHSVEEPVSKLGDKVVLRAEMDVLLGIAACSVSESTGNGGKCSPIKITIEE